MQVIFLIIFQISMNHCQYRPSKYNNHRQMCCNEQWQK